MRLAMDQQDHHQVWAWAGYHPVLGRIHSNLRVLDDQWDRTRRVVVLEERCLVTIIVTLGEPRLGTRTGTEVEHHLGTRALGEPRLGTRTETVVERSLVTRMAA